MCDRDAFLAAICARPDDDLPRLIFADWLDEHGDADRAEFIRLQCAAARGESGMGYGVWGIAENSSPIPHSSHPIPHTRFAARRIDELLQIHRDAWLGPLAQIVYGAEFRRGFVEHVVLPATMYLSDGSVLRQLTPLRSVALLKSGHVLPALLDGPHLHGLSALHLTGAKLGDDGARRLAASPALAGLRTLRLGQNDLGNSAAAALAHSPHQADLTTLVLDDNALTDTGAWHLARSPYLTRLTTLSLTGNEISPAGVAALSGSSTLTALTQLDVSNQSVPVGRWRMLAAAK